jgi:hypothetical protein
VERPIIYFRIICGGKAKFEEVFPMTITLKGEIEEHAIKLPEWFHLPDGTKVTIKIEPEISREEKLRLAESLCGAWADDPSIDSIFEEIEKERHNYQGKKIALVDLA